MLLIPKRAVRVVFSSLAALGIAVQLVVTIVAGNHLTTPWSGYGDVYQYVTLATNLRLGDGFTYAHTPTAFRPPLYPLVLAGLMWLSPTHWLALLHALQFVTSLVTAWVCAKLATGWFGLESRPIALAIALLLPTQLYFTGETLTECTASLLGILFLMYLDRAVQCGGSGNWILLGLVAGACALERFNFAALAVVAAFVAVGWPAHVSGRPRLRPLALFCATCAIVIAPWLVRTFTAFHGRALYSTHAGFGAVEGILSPTGRAQEGETQKIERVLGWGNWSVETNSPSRPELRDEIALNSQAWNVAAGLWRNAGWNLTFIASEKLGAFWLSTDQLFHLSMFSVRNRVLRRAGVAAYLVVLMLAIAGWFQLRTRNPNIAHVLLFYAIVLTALHLPLTMNTRLRSPLFDPLLASLGAGGVMTFLEKRSAILKTP
jgi:hypothetical protein